ncbi:MAG: hypothetical protein OEX18_11365 [Candidatus Krumholzibacteria bacterium]|nr:hypothetical protein [Candidatus Krumholzibacteria bacterium]
MKRVLQAIVVALAVVALAVSGAAAQRANSLEDGAWALQFGIEGQFISVNSYSGGVSLKRHFSQKSAFRAGISASAGDSERDHSDIDQVDGANSWSTGLILAYQRYINPHADAVLYWGIGPAFNYSHSSYNTSRGDSLSSEITSKRWSVGADAMLGAEWFATRVISLHAEYFAGFDYFSETESMESNVNGSLVSRQSNREGWSTSLTSAVRFGLSVYF